MNTRSWNTARAAAGFVVVALMHACGSSETSPGTPTTGSGGSGSTTSSSTTSAASTTGVTAAGAGGATTATTAGAGGSTTTGGTGGAAGSGPRGPKVDVPPGEPITAPAMTWTAVPVTGSICRDGQPTGFGVNLNPASTKLLIYLEGGGACFNTTTCAQAPRSWAPTNANLTAAQASTLFNRTGNSPFKDWNQVYIPYCSGDVFTGTAMSGFMGQPQMGYSNYVKFLQRLLGTFQNLTQVVLSGSSAGGFGIAYNWMVTQDAFGSVPVSALDDSGPPMSPDYLAPCQEQKVGALWGWAGSIHPACTTCDVAGGKVTRPLLQTSLARAGAHFALTSYDEDGVIKSFFGYGNNDCAGFNALLPPAYPAGKFPMGLAELRQAWSGSPQAAMFVVKGGGHTFLSGDLSRITTGTTTMLAWVTEFADNGAGWTNVVP